MKIDYLYDLSCATKKFRVNNRNVFSDLSETKDVGRHNFNIFQIVSNKTQEETKRECETCANLRKACKDLNIWCWSKDIVNVKEKDECVERYLMWRAYTNGIIGCRIETTVEKLLEALDSRYDYVLGEVIYGDRNCNRIITEQSETTWDLFHKNYFYADEQEVRLVVIPKQKENYIECVNLQNFLTKITISPFIHRNIAEVIQQSLSKIDGLNGVEIQTSQIYE